MGSEAMADDGYTEWCRANGCDHAHCPDGCEKPQPRLHAGQMVCGRCLIKFSEVVPVLPCGPGVCGG